MTKRVKRQSSSVPFSLSRWFRRISSTKPSSAIFTVAVIALTAFLLGGGLYQITAGTPLVFYDGSKFHYVYDSALGGSGLDGQLGMDTVFSATLYAFGLIGFLLMYQSTKNAYKPRQAYMTLIVGASLIAFAYIFLEAVLKVKIG
jgi:hypothetical protein